MMFSLTTFQLCWIFSILATSVQSQFTNPAVSTAVVNKSSSIFDKAFELREALVDRWLNAYLPSDENSWRTPLVTPYPEAEYQRLPTSTPLRHAMSSPNNIVAESTSQATALTSVISPMPLAPIGSTVISVPESSTLTSSSAALSTLPITSTITVRTTVVVSPTPTTPPTTALENSLPSTTSAMTSNVTQSATPVAMTPMVQVGLGLGITVLILLLSGIAGLFLWRRRKGSRNDNDDTTKPNGRSFLARMFNFRRLKNNKDAEWSIESVEKVSIVGNMRAQSVLTVSRSNSRRSDGSSETGAIPIGIRGRAMTVALNSHPMTPSYTSFASKDSDAKILEPGSVGEELKPSGWPLEK